jgi:hypothetical protein
VDTGDASGGLPMRGRGGRGAARRGSPDEGDGEVDCVLTWVNGAAGGSTSFGDLRLALESLIHCKRIRAEGIKGCARAGEGE